MSIWEKDQADSKGSAFDKITKRPAKRTELKPITQGQMIFKSEYISSDGYGRIFFEWKPRTSYRIVRIKAIQQIQASSVGTMRSVSVKISDDAASIGSLKAADFVTIPDGITYLDPGDGIVQGPSPNYNHIFVGAMDTETAPGASNYDADYPLNLILKAGKTYTIACGSTRALGAAVDTQTTYLFLDYEQIPD